jgi:DNA (cytosine-5)-methyltransferase 1
VTAYYNEHDPKAAAWLRELIKADLIAPGDVDERSIEDVLPSELAGYTQCHFFAGIGVWSYALRCAGWPDSRPAWTGSCPCQPFSAAGKRGGTSDERHLWPAFHWLISQRKPDVVFGEQVESKDGRAWLDTVQADLEAASYAFGAVGMCAAGVGAPHIRQRLLFVADAARGRFDGPGNGGARRRIEPSIGGFARSLANANGPERRSPAERWADDADRTNARRKETPSGLELCGEAGGMANADGGNASTARLQRSGEHGQFAQDGGISGGPTNGFWQNAEWLYCRDEKYRAVEPGTFPLADGAAARVGRLRGYGNAIVAPVAEEFIRAYLEAA